MASGFMQRFKGKIECDSLWVAGQPLAGSAAGQKLALMSSSLGASTATGSVIIALTSASTTQAIIRLTPPAFIGQQRTIQVSTLNGAGLGVILTASTNGSITFNGSSLSVAASTGSTAQVLELVATSSANWAVTGEYPFSSTGLWTLSTSS